MTFFGRAAGDACRRGGDALEKGRKGGYSSGGLGAEAALAQGGRGKTAPGQNGCGLCGETHVKGLWQLLLGLAAQDEEPRAQLAQAVVEILQALLGVGFGIVAQCGERRGATRRA